MEAQFGVASQNLPCNTLIAALMDAIWTQRDAYVRARKTLVVCPELVGGSAQWYASVPLLFLKRMM